MLGLKGRVRAKEHRGCWGAEVRLSYSYFCMDVRALVVCTSLFANRRNLGRDINAFLITNEIRKRSHRHCYWAHSIATGV